MDNELKELLVEQQKLCDTITELGKRKRTQSFEPLNPSFCQWDDEDFFKDLDWDLATEMVKTSDVSCQTKSKMVDASTQTASMTPPKPAPPTNRISCKAARRLQESFAESLKKLLESPQ